MADVHDIETRSYNMSKIKGTDTKPEMLVRKFLHAKGLRYLLHNKKLPGKPDLTLPKYRTVIFVNGCFWHGHENCRYFVVPKTHTKFWLDKIEETKVRDSKSISLLEKEGWKVLTIFECELKPDKLQKTLSEVLNIIESNY